MGLEIVAARVLAPALGNSIYVWGSVISVVMVALSLGYWLGGQPPTDTAPRASCPPRSPGQRCHCAAPLVAAVLPAVVAELGPRVGSLSRATLIYFFPALLLAMVSPLGVASPRHVGCLMSAARPAVSTPSRRQAASRARWLTSFWLIPLLSLEPLIVWTGFVLAATAFAALAPAGRTRIGDHPSGTPRLPISPPACDPPPSGRSRSSA